MDVEDDLNERTRTGGDVIAQSRAREAMEPEIRPLCWLFFLFFFGIRALFERHRAMAVVTVGIVGTGLVLYSGFTMWEANGSWGPRFLVVLTPFFLLPAVMFRPNRRWRRVLVFFLLVVGFGVQLVPALVPYQHAAVAQHFADQPSPQRYFSSTEIVPHLQELTAGGIEFWWSRTPVLGLIGAWMILFEVYLGRRLIQTLRSTRTGTEPAGP